MTSYRAPLDDIGFLVRDVLDLEGLVQLPPYREMDLNAELVLAVLEEAGKLAGEVLAPLRRVGDQDGARLVDGKVLLPDGFGEAFRAMAEGGWFGVSLPEEHGGQGLPELLHTVTGEFWSASNMAFALAPMLTSGAAIAILTHGSDQQKATYLTKLSSGQWSGTMNLTEADAGSDLSAVKTKAVREGDHYRISGQKVFITWGDHELAENIIHLVLGRTPDAPPGTKGISLFIVPKYLVNEDGSIGAENDVKCVSLEHKLGIHASPTCVMSFGDTEGSIGYLVGEENKGLIYMFTMMNEARLKVGVEGLAVTDGAYQEALAYARERVQGATAESRGQKVTIIHHPDVRRMLLTMKAVGEAMRALAYDTAIVMDKAHYHPDEAVRAASQLRVDLLIPIIKGWCTEMGQEMSSLGIQVHGGVGYVEEAGAAQYFRDARIASIYEGTNGIQAADLVGRKLGRDAGAAMASLIAEIRETAVAANGSSELETIGVALGKAVDGLERATRAILAKLVEDPREAMVASFNYMMAAGYVCGGWQMARSALAAARRRKEEPGNKFFGAKLTTALFYAKQVLPRVEGLLPSIEASAPELLGLDEELF